MKPFRVAVLAASLVASILHPATARAQGALPPVLQAALMARIFQADDSLRGKPRDEAKLLLVRSKGTPEATVRGLMEALGPTQVLTQEVEVDALDEAKGVAAIYVADAADAPAVRRYCVEHSVLSLAGDTVLAEQGLVAVGLGTRADHHPEIVVNMKQLTAQHHALAATLLKLARVVDG